MRDALSRAKKSIARHWQGGEGEGVTFKKLDFFPNQYDCVAAATLAAMCSFFFFFYIGSYGVPASQPASQSVAYRQLSSHCGVDVDAMGANVWG